MTIAACGKFLILIIVLGLVIAGLYLILQGMHGLEHPAYVEYTGDPEEKASVNIYAASRRYKGYRSYDFLNKNGKWKYIIEKKTIIYILGAAVLLLLIEVISLGVNGALESLYILPVLLIDLFFATLIFAIPIADIVRAYSALDDDLRKRKEQS